jgi:hypothetical protein
MRSTMTLSCKSSSEPERVNRRHLLGFRRFQSAALKALAVAVGALDDEGNEDASKKLAVKVGDMKSLVSAYKEAVTGERMVLGLGDAVAGDWPEEMVVRWVEDEQLASKEGDS